MQHQIPKNDIKSLEIPSNPPSKMNNDENANENGKICANNLSQPIGMPQQELDGIEPSLPLDWFDGRQIGPSNGNPFNSLPGPSIGNAPSIRPWSAYALFFREVQSEIRTQRTTKERKSAASLMSFGELSKTIAKRWQKMGRKEKSIYRERLKELRRMQLRSKASLRAFELGRMKEMDSGGLDKNGQKE